MKNENNLSNNLLERLAHIKKIAWKPIVEEGDGGISDSKIAGLPWLAKDEEWPICPNCNKPMQFFLQINLEKLPIDLQSQFGDGLLQMFYCTSREPFCEANNEAWLPFAESELIRIIQPAGEPNEVSIPEFIKNFPAKRIVNWEKSDDYPDMQDLEELHEIYLKDEEFGEYAKSKYPIQGEKLAGYPFWCQSIAYPACPICRKQMELLFQIDSEKLIPFMWSDNGMGHITQCPDHKKQVSFAWDSH